MTPLRQRFLDDLRLRNYSPRTVEAYLAAVVKLTRHFGTAPDQATYSTPDPQLASQIAGLRHRCGQVDVIENQALAIPGSVNGYDLRAQNPHGAFGGPMLQLLSGHYPTTAGQDQGIVQEASRPPSGENLNASTLGALVEPYPQVIAGTPLSWGFDREKASFSLRYSTQAADGTHAFRAGSVTPIHTPKLSYPSRHGVHVSGGRPASTPGGTIAVCEAGSA